MMVNEMNERRANWVAWIEDAQGTETPVHGNCSLGRSAQNHLVVDDPLVSRRHALIQAQQESEYWLVDFGSCNGTYLNQRRIVQPTRLKAGDQVRIGSRDYRFHQVQHPELLSNPGVAAEQTVFDVRLTQSWLLVADIIGSTGLVTRLPPDQLPLVTGKWLASCRDIIESCEGRINQFMGDGFFAYWRDHPGREADVVQAMTSLRQLQLQALPPFRIVIHFAPVVFGGVAIGEEERISGGDVHYVFRMEKLAGQLKIPCLLSDAAQVRLAALLPTRDVGDHLLPGFQQAARFHAWTG